MKLAEALRAATTDLDNWHASHQGELIRIVGHVWWCGDEYCNCTQATITAQFRNRVVRQAIVPRTLWEGEFHTDGEQGASDELAAKKVDVETAEPDIAQSIEWAS